MNKINCFYYRTLISTFIVFLLPVIFVSLTGANPYEGVNWEEDGKYKAQLHCHTTVSDGRMPPQDVVDKYKRLGYSILSITDHNRVTYPWTNFSNINPSGLSQNRYESETLQIDHSFPLKHLDRDPDKLNMIAISGAEPSSHHHMGTYFCNVPWTSTVAETLAKVRNQTGLAVMFHPHSYDWSVEDYVELFKEWDELIGMEVHNCGFCTRGCRELWDDVLTELMPERPVWGFSNDDMHSSRQMDQNWNTFILPELTEDEVRRAMAEGRFYFSVVDSAVDEAPSIESIRVENNSTIQIEASGYRRITWISNGEVVHQGESIDLRKLKEKGGYMCVPN